MNFLKSRMWTAGEIISLKWASALGGAVIGAYLASFVKAYVGLIVALVVILSIKPLRAYFRK